MKKPRQTAGVFISVDSLLLFVTTSRLTAVRHVAGAGRIALLIRSAFALVAVTAFSAALTSVLVLMLLAALIPIRYREWLYVGVSEPRTVMPTGYEDHPGEDYAE